MKYLFLCWLLFIYLSVYSQVSPYTLPNDPIQANDWRNYNWLKSSTESALNNTDDQDLRRPLYFKNYFYEHSNLVTSIVKNESISSLVFNWVKPYLKQKIESLSLDAKINLYNTITSSINYLENMKYSYETEYLSKVSEEGNNPYNLFAYKSPHDFFDENWQLPFPDEISDKNRNINAFLYRRIAAGIDKKVLIAYLKKIVGFVNVNFKGYIEARNSNNSPLRDYTWNQTGFDGIYKEYDDSRIVINGLYRNGKKNGLWKYYGFTNSLYRFSTPRGFKDDHIPHITHEILYNEDRPIKLTKYHSEEVTTVTGEKKNCDIVMNLDIDKKVLTVDVYLNDTLKQSFNSISDRISFWDLFENQKRIIASLNAPNFDIEINTRITLQDKPPVDRNTETGNYKLYDQLKRQGKDHALFIATDEYSAGSHFPQLKNPINDAKTIAQDLNDIYGFDSEILKNPTKSDVLKKLKDYKNKRFDSTEQLLIYITGHGDFERNLKEGYLLFKDSKNPDYDINHDSWLSYSELLNNLSEINSKHILLMVDACYSGALRIAVAKSKGDDDDLNTKFREPALWFLNRIRYKTRIFITSTAAEKQSSDGINHSPFASMFLKSLRSYGDKTHIMSINEVYSYIDAIMPSPYKQELDGNDPESSFFFVMK